MSERSSEIVEASPVSGLNSHKISIISSQPLIESGLEPRSRITADVLTDLGSREVTFIEKQVNPDDYIKKWTSFKNAGLPVVPTVRRTDRGTILMTDLKADGSQLYGRSASIDYKNGITNGSSGHPLDRKFLELKKNNFKEIRQKAEKLSAKAASHGIYLPDDDPFELLLHPDGQWELITLDFSHAQVIPVTSENVIVDIADTNFHYVNYFMNDLAVIGKHLSPRQSFLPWLRKKAA